MKTINLLVFGTSIMWGQGLEEPDKIHNVLAQMLQEHRTTDKVNVYSLAHSGASTGFKADGSIDTHRESRIHGEVPTLYPTIVQEFEEFDELGLQPESIDIILLDAGINDVHVTEILDPLTMPHRIEEHIEIYCHQHMILLLEQLLAKFRNAKIIIVGYYEFLTEESEESYIHILLKAFGLISKILLADIVLGLADGLLKDRLLTNCKIFAEQSLTAFQQTAAELNSQHSEQRVFVADPQIKTENAAFTSDPWLFGINDDLSPQDPLAGIRTSACHSTSHKRTQPLFCEKASAGHPNPKGARSYANAIFALLEKESTL